MTTAQTLDQLNARAAARLATLTTAQAIEQWNLTDQLLTDLRSAGKGGSEDSMAVIQARQWLLADLERRDGDALLAWLDSGADDPTPFYA